MFFDGKGGLGGDGIIGFVTIGHGEVKGQQWHIKMGLNESFFDVLPDDARHLIAFNFHNGLGDGNFCHALCYKDCLTSSIDFSAG